VTASLDETIRRRSGTVREPRVTLAQGGGGKAMRDLIDDVFAGAFANERLCVQDDQARLPLADLAPLGDRLALTTDSYVVDPIEFPGGDIGRLAVCGTVNDLAVGGAVPLYLTCGVILEEGLEIAVLRRVVASMAAAAAEAGVAIVTGDTKVVPAGACDRIFINTAGVGVIARGRRLSASSCVPGDAVLVSGFLGDHGAAILKARGDMALEALIESDVAPLGGLVQSLLDAVPATRFLRDATRGGVATVLNEIAEASAVGIEAEEDAFPIRPAVHGFCEILGMDALYLANEGKLVAVVPPADEAAALGALRAHPLGRDACTVGRVTSERRGRVVMRTVFGGHRIVDMMIGEQLPRIC
jgi:hydrogenase expression/formation protein HypE